MRNLADEAENEKNRLNLFLCLCPVSFFSGCSGPAYAEKDEFCLSQLAGKTFQCSGGQLLTFYDEGVATYDFKNGVGGNHHYNYRVYVVQVTDTELVMNLAKIKKDSASYHTEDAIDDETEAAPYYLAENKLFYYQTYSCIYNAKNADGSEERPSFSNSCTTFTTVCATDGARDTLRPQATRNTARSIRMPVTSAANL